MGDQGHTYRVYIDCYDAYGFYEENYRRIILVMNALNSSRLVSREWVSSQAVGGSWARSIRCVFETDIDPKKIKEQMIGLEYCSVGDLPDDLRRQVREETFRFADIDVIEVKVSSGSLGRITDKLRPSERKVEKAELMGDEASKAEFILSCRRRLLDALDDATREELFRLESEILARALPK